MDQLWTTMQVRDVLALDCDKSCVTVCGTVESIDAAEPDTIVRFFDGSCFKTIVSLVPSEVSASLGEISPWTTIEVKGRYCINGRLLRAHNVRVLGSSDEATHPLASTTLTYPHLRLRTRWRALLLRFRSAAETAAHDHFTRHPSGKFYQVRHPVVTWTDGEGGAEVFPVLNQISKKDSVLPRDDFFGRRCFLTVTAAIHGEAFAMGLDRIWMLAPCFRAERVDDERHLAEFTMLEMALNYVESLDAIVDMCEGFVVAFVNALRGSDEAKELFSAIGRMDTTSVTSRELHTRWDLLSKPRWPRIRHSEAVKLLLQEEAAGQVSFEKSPQPDMDLSFEHEVYLTKLLQGPVFVTHYPTKIRLFSALQSAPPTEPGALQTTESMDLLLPEIGEIVSGGLREHRLDRLAGVMRGKDFFRDCEAKVRPAGAYPYLKEDESFDSLEWFADLRRWGTSPHGGCGLGFERLLWYLTGAKSAKEMIAFPRYFQSCEA